MIVRSPDLIGRVVAGKYAIEALIGNGGMGAVYLARHLGLDEAVAIKILHRVLQSDSTFADRFQREARAAARLHHPCSVRVTDYGEDTDGLLYIVMELVDGRDLARVLESEWPLAPERVARILSQTLSALGAAHDAGIIHRDLKPENVLVVAGFDEDDRPVDFVKVCDFGIAKDMRAARTPGVRPAAVTTTGFVVGTPAYMSPEQGRGKPLDPRSDLYSVGVVLYELLTGRVPFEADDVIGVVMMHVTEDPIPPSKITSVHPVLEAACLKALAKNPDDRFASAREMQDALRPLAGKHSVTPTRVRASSPSHLAEIAPSRVPTQQATVTNVSSRRDAPTTRGAQLLRAAVFVALAAMTGAIGLRAASDDKVVASTRTGSVVPSAPPRDEPPPTPAPTLDSVAPPPNAPASSNERARARRGTPTTTTTTTTTATTTTTTTATATATTTAIATTLFTEPAAPAPPPAFDSARASVRIAGISADGALVRDVSNAVARAIGRMTACYQNDLRMTGVPKSGSGTLRIETDGAGAVTRVRASVGFLPSIARCLEASVVGLRIAGVDTGEASATIALGFDIR